LNCIGTRRIGRRGVKDKAVYRQLISSIGRMITGMGIETTPLIQTDISWM
jgi:hypothetical protein